MTPANRYPDQTRTSLGDGSMRGGLLGKILPPLKRAPSTSSSAAAAAAAAAAVRAVGGGTPGFSSPGGKRGESPISSLTPPGTGTAARSSSPTSAMSHISSTRIKLQACSTIKLSAVVGMGDLDDDVHEFGDDDVRPNSSARSRAGSGESGVGGGSVCGGLLVASVSECDGSNLGGDGCSSSGEEVSEDGSEDDSYGSSDAAAKRLRTCGPPARNRSTVSQQLLEVADMVASDVAMGGSPAHSNLIKRMTVVSLFLSICFHPESWPSCFIPNRYLGRK